MRREEKEASYKTGSDAASPSSLSEDSNISEALEGLFSNYTKIPMEWQEGMLKCCLSLLAQMLLKQKGLVWIFHTARAVQAPFISKNPFLFHIHLLLARVKP